MSSEAHQQKGRKTLRPTHCYLLLQFHASGPLESYQVKEILEQGIRRKFGRAGLAEGFDLLHGKSESNQFTVRVHNDAYSLFRAGLCLVHTYDNQPCSVQVLQVSSSLSSLASPRFLDLSVYEAIAA